MKKIKIVIVDNNIRIVQLLKDIIQEEEDMEAAAIAFNGLEALSVIERENPEIVLLDLIMPKLDGLAILEKMSKENHSISFIILTAVRQEYILETALELGASCCIKKPFHNEEVIDAIRKIKGQVPLKFFNDRLPSKMNMKKKYIPFDLELRVTVLIHKIGIPAHIKGYYFLRDAIVISVVDGGLLNSVTKLLYPVIAKIHNTTSVKVESAIRHAIMLVWNSPDKHILNELLGYTVSLERKKLTNSEFIALLADKFRIYYKIRA